MMTVQASRIAVAVKYAGQGDIRATVEKKGRLLVARLSRDISSLRGRNEILLRPPHRYLRFLIGQ